MFYMDVEGVPVSVCRSFFCNYFFLLDAALGVWFHVFTRLRFGYQQIQEREWQITPSSFHVNFKQSHAFSVKMYLKFKQKASRAFCHYHQKRSCGLLGAKT